MPLPPIAKGQLYLFGKLADARTKTALTFAANNQLQVTFCDLADHKVMELFLARSNARIPVLFTYVESIFDRKLIYKHLAHPHQIIQTLALLKSQASFTQPPT